MDLLSEMFYLVSTGGKPCWVKEFSYFENMINDHIRDYKTSLIRCKKYFPDVKIYYFRVPKAYPNGHPVLGSCRLYCLFLYKYEFEKQLLRRSLGLGEGPLCHWGINGLLFGYSRDQIQARYDQNVKTFPTLHSTQTLR
jgi:hypothetical protein